MYDELFNSTGAAEVPLPVHASTLYGSGTSKPVSSSVLYVSTARAIKEGEISKPDLMTYLALFFLLLLSVSIIVLFINCQLKNSFFSTLPYDRSLRETRTPWKTQAV